MIIIIIIEFETLIWEVRINSDDTEIEIAIEKCVILIINVILTEFEINLLMDTLMMQK